MVGSYVRLVAQLSHFGVWRGGQTLSRYGPGQLGKHVLLSTPARSRLYSFLRTKAKDRSLHETKRAPIFQVWQRNLCTGPPISPLGEAAAEDWSEHEFVKVAEASLELVSDHVSSFGFDGKNAHLDFDIELSQGVLTISLGSHGTYVLNTQTPNRQIWMSSPRSGPWRYAWYPDKKSWFSSRDGHSLASRLTQELSEIFEESVNFSFTDVSPEG